MSDTILAGQAQFSVFVFIFIHLSFWVIDLFENTQIYLGLKSKRMFTLKAHDKGIGAPTVDIYESTK